ncbi:MAG: Ig-like domain-containing protein [Gemmatimonadaceae bacterium]|nr:Ig-like domain-containing protein [Gemmatimonadaceae bacterium]
MRSLHRIRARWTLSSRLLGVAALAVMPGCRGERPLGPRAVKQVAVVALADTIRPGQTAALAAVALNVSGDLLDVPIAWRSLTPALASVDADGNVLALAPGVATIRATASAVFADQRLFLVNPPAADLVDLPDSLILTLPGPPVRVTAQPVDAGGAQIIGAPTQWTSDAARIAIVSGDGIISPIAIGRAVLTVQVDGVSRTMPVRVTPTPSAAAPIITEVAPLLIHPGELITVRGEGFTRAPSGASVFVDGRALQLTSLSDTLLTGVLASAGLPCLPTSDVFLQVTTESGIAAQQVRLQVAPQRSPAVGTAELFLSAAEARCVELPGDGRYLVTVVNAARALGSGGVTTVVEGLVGAGTPSLLASVEAVGGFALTAHSGVLEGSRRQLQQMRLAPTSALQPALQLPAVGGITAVRIPDLDAANFCVSYRPIDARVVYLGSTIAIVEDTISMRDGVPTLAGTMDAAIAALGTEVETVIWPLLSRFGNPLVMDSRLDDNGRVVIVLSPVMNELRNGEVLGAVVSCDFFPRAQLPSSNVGEMLYLQVPTSAAAGMVPGTIERWRHEVRGTIAHELKHVVSFAERIVRGQLPEESWLEEAGALHAEEVYARAVLGLSATGNTGYDAIRCEVLVLVGAADCHDTPRLLRPHAEALWRFLSASQVRSPLGPTTVGDRSYYGSAWSLLRWALDHAAASEATFTTALTTGGLSGVANLEARAGRSWDQMLLRWSLALASDGRAGLTVTDSTLQFPSWDLASLFAGFCADIGSCGGVSSDGLFTSEQPLQARVAAGNFAYSTANVPPGGFTIVDIAPGAAGTRMLLRLSSGNGTPPHQNVRLAVLRVQ